MRKEMYQGDCLEVMKGIEDESIDSIVTDPPYGLSFMGKKWDYQVPSVEIWKECLRVLKPGGTALIFAGSRTQHRMAVNVEDAGFILKDCIMWIYGSGFPKSTDISKQIDKKAGVEREIIRTEDTRSRYDGLKRNSTGEGDNVNVDFGVQKGTVLITKPSTPAAQLWDGYGTALKPAYEPIIVAMKPNDGTYANNALKHGVAGINIDGCRVEAIGADLTRKSRAHKKPLDRKSQVFESTIESIPDINKGRFPANIIHNGSEEVLELFPETKSGKDRNPAKNSTSGFTGNGIRTEDVNYGDSGSAARFFYCAKASKKERGEDNNHPTVKPIALMEYLCKLVKMPTGGILLDPFLGSSTTGIACKNLEIDFIGIEKDSHYFQIAKNRICN